jgi:hypothetical protein
VSAPPDDPPTTVSDLAKHDLGDLVGRLTADDLSRGERGRLLVVLTRAVGVGARAAGSRATLSGRWLAEWVADEIAPHVPVRDLLTLRVHHGGLSGDELARALIHNAALTTAAVGAAAGAVAAAEMTVPPTMLAAPVQLAAETVAVIAVELKLVAELHVVYGKAPQGSRGQVTTAYLTSWASRRGLDGAGVRPSLSSVLSTAARQQLRHRILRQFRRNVSSLAPFLVGAVAGAELNRRATRSLGEALMLDLRRRG